MLKINRFFSTMSSYASFRILKKTPTKGKQSVYKGKQKEQNGKCTSIIKLKSFIAIYRIHSNQAE